MGELEAQPGEQCASGVEQHVPPKRIPERIRGGERFRRTQRLRSSRDFQHVRARGRTLGGPLLAIGYARQPETAAGAAPVGRVPSRVGFSISKRVGKAVVRNLVKRRLRESIRRVLSRLAPGWDIVITARPAAAGASYDELRAELDRLLTRARLLGADTPGDQTLSGQPRIQTTKPSQIDAP